jgi:hypothetical protein
MRKIITVLVIVVVSAVLLSGCALVATPVGGTIFTDVQWPGGITSNTGAGKSGQGDCMSILGLVGIGDCSIQTIAHNAHITKIQHVDYETFSCLFVFGKLTVTVYGE